MPVRVREPGLQASTAMGSSCLGLVVPHAIQDGKQRQGSRPNPYRIHHRPNHPASALTPKQGGNQCSVARTASATGTAVTRKLVGSRTQLRPRLWLPASNSLRYSRTRHHHRWLPAHGTDDRTAAACTHPWRSGHYRMGSPEPSGLRTSSRVHRERVGCKWPARK
jgi:hypothetical protein